MSDQNDKRTSQEWCDFSGVKILDPDGWDRSNFKESWNELITRDEFDNRMMRSTISLKLK